MPWLTRPFVALWMFAAIATPVMAQGATITTKVIDIWPGVAPGSELWTRPETVTGSDGNHRVMNVITPTLTAYLPDPSTATGTAVIIAPSGGFVWLLLDSEGHEARPRLGAGNSIRQHSACRRYARSHGGMEHISRTHRLRGFFSRCDRHVGGSVAVLAAPSARMISAESVSRSAACSVALATAKGGRLWFLGT
jgi:hypothetical protein